MSSVEQNVQIISELYQAFGRGDIPTVLSYIDANPSWGNAYGAAHFPGQWGKPAHNHAEIAGFFQAINEAVEVQGFEVKEMVAQNDKVIALGNWKGVVRKNGKPFSDMLTHIWTPREGKVVDYKGLHDPTAYPFS
jgi:ketosteroid isomerase-like protein